MPTSFQQLTFTSFPTHKSIFSSYTCRLFQRCRHRFSNLPLQVSQLINQFLHHILLVASFRGADIASATYLFQVFQLIFSIFHHILPLVLSFLTYSSFLSCLFSLYSSPLVPSFITYSSSFNSRLFSPKRKLLAERNLYRRVPAN